MQGAPLVVLNSFGGEEHLKLATVLFQNLFPAINVHTTSLKSCKVILKFWCVMVVTGEKMIAVVHLLSCQHQRESSKLCKPSLKCTWFRRC